MKLLYKRLEGQSGHEAGRQLLQQLCGGELPEIAYTKLGKPYFVDSPLHFSVSHTSKTVFCCISDQNVGIDAESCDRIARPVYLSRAEQAQIESSADPQRDFLRLWVLKEAYAKLTGKGVGNYLKETDFTPDDPRITEIDGCFVAVLTEKDVPHAF